jgi:tRNA(Ile)-lysidine synthase
VNDLAGWVARLRDVDDLAGTCAVAACSGGPDSSALLVLAVEAGVDCVAVYVDHGLQPAAAGDAAAVERLAARLGIPATVRHLSVARGPNLEARARAARHRALEGARQEVGASAVLLGHTADDQAETVLLALLRGGALGALAGMPARRGWLRRPLLGLRRRDTLEVCARRGIAWRDDPMNADEAFARVWLRRRVLPMLCAAADRDVVPVLARQAELAADDLAVLEALAEERLAGAGDPPDREVVAAAPVAVARRALRRLLGDPPPSADELERCLAVARGEARRVELRGGRAMERVGRALRVTTGPPVAVEPVTLTVPGSAVAGRLRVRAWVDQQPPVGWPDGTTTAVLDADAVGGTLVVRSAHPDDRIRPLGASGTKRMPSVLAEIGVPRAHRGSHPVVVDPLVPGRGPGGEPVWVLGYRVADRVRVRRSTTRYLWLAAEEEQ